MDLRDYLRVLSRRRVLIVGVTLVVAAASIAATLLSSREATSRAVATAPAVRADGVIVPMSPDVAIEREIEVARSEQVFERAASETGESADALRLNVVIAPAGATSRGTIAFTATDADASRAAELANAVAASYVSVTNEALLADLERYRDAVRAGSAEASDETLAFLEGLDATPLDLSELSVGRQATALDARLADLSALMDMESSHAQLVNPAAPLAPEGGVGRNAVLGVTLGLFLGVAGAFVQEQIDDRVRHADGVRRAFPHASVFDATGTDGRSAEDTMRLLAAAVSGSSSSAPVRTVLVAAPTAGARSAAVAAGLASALAEQGAQVVGVSWTDASGSMAELLGGTDGPGLAGVVNGEGGVEGALNGTRIAGVRMLPAGSSRTEATAVRSSSAARDAVRSLRSGAATLVIDSAPLLEGADAGYLIGEVDGVILVARTDVTRLTEVGDSAALLDELGLPLRAIVLAGRDR